MLMRDPLLLRIRHAPHYRRGDAWCVYPLYDFAHGLSDAFEGITHSLCTLEFKDNRELYDWLVREAGFDRPPEQTEFARLELDYTVLSKRKLLRLVNEGHVRGWDDPRHADDRGASAPRRHARGHPRLRRYDRRGALGRADRARDVRARGARRPQHAGAAGDGRRPAAQAGAHELPGRTGRRRSTRRYTRTTCRSTGSRPVPFSRELWIERDDFMEDPPKKFFRLAPGREVRLRYGYLVTCTDVMKDAAGGDRRAPRAPTTRRRAAATPRTAARCRARSTGCRAGHALDCELRLYDRLFAVPDPDAVPEGQDFVAALNPALARHGYRARRSSRAWRATSPGTRYQFERTGYFISDPVDSRAGALVFNRTVALRDSWAKVKDK